MGELLINNFQAEDYVDAFGGAQARKDGLGFFEDEDEDEKENEPAWKICRGMSLKFFPGGHKEGLFFEMNERCLIQHRSQTSGNPVKIRDGCATVTADKFPGPLFRSAGWEGGKAV
jgi:hypothetical protein